MPVPTQIGQGERPDLAVTFGADVFAGAGCAARRFIAGTEHVRTGCLHPALRNGDGGLRVRSLVPRGGLLRSPSRATVGRYRSCEATLFRHVRWLAMTTHTSLRPMTEFNPFEPAVLHDRATDEIVTWSGEEADDYRRSSAVRRDGTVAWKTFVFDGWGHVLGG